MTTTNAAQIASQLKTEGALRTIPTTAGLTYSVPAPGSIGDHEVRMVPGTAGTPAQTTRWARKVNKALKALW